MIEIRNLTKRYGDVLAVDDLSFDVRPGVVTGFLGPNGAGKSTTMRMILGLDRSTSGSVRVNGRQFRDSRVPLKEIGALLDAKAVDKDRSARNHLLALGATVGIGKKRVNELLEVVGLSEVGNKRAGGFSLGMGQRLGIAAALIADPKIVMLDEPVNGLDPDGILWVRNFLRDLAAEGRTVFLSSHLMSEMEMTAEHLIVVGRGRLIADVSMSEFIERASKDSVRVVSPQAERLGALLRAANARMIEPFSNGFEVEGISATEIGGIAASHEIELHELTPIRPSLEEAFMELTKNDVQYRGERSVHGAHSGGQAS